MDAEDFFDPYDDYFDSLPIEEQFQELGIRVHVHSYTRKRGSRQCIISGTEQHIQSAIAWCRSAKPIIHVIYNKLPKA